MWKLNKLLNKNTVIIVTGCHLFCELLDRPVAEYLKKEIDLCGDYKFGKRAIIMRDRQFLADTDESRNNQITEYDLEHYNLPLWGNTATATKETVVEFVKNTNSGLTKFLEKIW